MGNCNEQKHQELVIRLNETLEKIKQDNKTLRAIQDRNFIKCLFSNNTRDLARVGIEQSELIFDLHKDFQELLKLYEKMPAQIAELANNLNHLMRRTNKNFADVLKHLIDVRFDLGKVADELLSVKNVVDDHSLRLSSAESVDGVCLMIKELAKKEGRSVISKFQKICEELLKCCSGCALSNNHARTIKLAFDSSDWNDKCLSGEELNKIQPSIVEMFKDVVQPSENSCKKFSTYLFENKPLEERNSYTMSEVITEVLDAAFVHDEERYTEYRKELLQLIDEFIDHDIDVEDNDREILSDVRRKLNENQFEIALIGEFQGGKSTTFNTLCGGREISPRGLNGGGIKTSATVISAQNIYGNETKDGLTEWAEITWLNERDIKLRLISVLKDQVKSADLLNKLKKDADKVDDDTIGLCIKHAWELCPKDDALDMLRIATLQFKLLNDSQLMRFLRKKIVAVDEFQKMVVFPEDWESRWEAKGETKFSADEGLFAFIDSVLVRIHSDALAYLGCRITDCPGLFVCKWDTERAEKVMKKADAIWYLLSGDKQIGEPDKKALGEIANQNFQDKTFFSVNRRKEIRPTEKIKETDISILKDFGFASENVFICDAFAAFRAAQLKLAVTGLPIRDRQILGIEAERDIADSAILKTIVKFVKRHLSTIGEEEIYDRLEDMGGEISDDVINELKICSGIVELMSKLNKFVINNKARSILIDNGVNKCCNALEHIDSNLKVQVAAAQKSMDEAQADAKSKTKELNDFIVKWQKQFDFLKATSVDEAIAADFFRDKFDEISNYIKRRAVQICKNEWHGSYYDSSDVNAAVERKISEKFLETIKAHLKSYLRSLGNQPRFKADFLDKVERNYAEMAEEWQDLKGSSDLYGSVEVAMLSDLTYENDSFTVSMDGKIDVPWYSWELVKDIYTLGIRRLFESPDDRIEEFFEKEKPVEDALLNFRQKAGSSIANYFGVVRKQIDDDLTFQFNAMKDRLQNNVEKSMNIVKEKNQKQEAVAEKAEDVRCNIVKPYMARIEVFKRNVERVYVK